MPKDVIDNLHKYACFPGSSLGHVVVEAPKLVFKKDPKFKAWQIQPQNSLPKAAEGPKSSATAMSPQSPDHKRDSRATRKKLQEDRTGTESAGLLGASGDQQSAVRYV
ncbi:MAG TPA: hypothetical protein VMT20_07620 [Terriglobia bacterium]|nr:hypothetical protein [Terriglobia bacterium]